MTPTETKAALVGTLAVTFVAVAELLRRASDADVSGRTAGAFLVGFSLLFFLRVAGQVVVRVRAPAWLPLMGQWNLVPYRILLPIQLVFLAVMAWIDYDLLREDGLAETRSPALGSFLVAFSALYAGSMGARYAIRMRRRPGERWFGGTIPIVFHVVLAAYLLTLGTYHAG
jgi:hypothetical protein